MHEEFVEDIPRQQSYLRFLFEGLGYQYAALLPLAAILSFILVLVLVLRGKGSWVPAAMILIVPLPLLIGVYGVIEGFISMYQVIASAGMTPKQTDLAEGIAMSLLTAWLGMLLSIPSFLLAAIGSFIRSLLGDPVPSSQNLPMAASIVESKR